MQTYTEWAERYGVSMDSVQVESNPYIDDMPEGSTHYLCTFEVADQDGTLSVNYSMGPAHTSGPELDDVLDSLASEAAGYENAQAFEPWAEEYGYSTDSRRAERIYNAIRKQSERLHRFIGQEAYYALLWDTERL